MEPMEKSESSFKDKIVLITGASAGIGEASAKKFAKLGASLALTGRDNKALDDVAAECKKLGAPEVLTVVAEFTRFDDIRNVFDMTIKKFSQLDILVNNVGVLRAGNLESLAMDDFDYQFNVNVKSVIYLTQLAMPYLLNVKGAVVNVSSLAAICQEPGILLYGMTKSALDQFTKTIALEYAPKGVRINSVNPSMVATSFNRNRGLNKEQSDKYYEEFGKRIPMGRCGLAEEIADAIVFLASEKSSWTTGQCFVLDGGRSLTSS